MGISCNRIYRKTRIVMFMYRLQSKTLAKLWLESDIGQILMAAKV
jgi:hypothetical protein